MNSRRKGIVWELKLLKELQGIFPEALTSRNASRKADSCGCDYVFTKNLCIQVKATKAEINPFKLYEELLNRQQLPGCNEKDIVLVKVYQASQYRRQDYDIIVFLPLYLFRQLNFSKCKYYVVKQIRSGWRARYFTQEYKDFIKVLAGTINFEPLFMVVLTWRQFVSLLKQYYNGL